MKIRQLRTDSEGVRSFEIQAGELSYRALLRRIKSINGAHILESAHDPMNDNTKITVEYKGLIINIDTPFSDYIINCSSSDKIFDEFISDLSNAPVRWWEHFV